MKRRLVSLLSRESPNPRTNRYHDPVLRSLLVLLSLTLAACTTTETLRYAQPALRHPVRTFALTVKCEHCSAVKLDADIQRILIAVLPCSMRVPDIATAEVTFRYSEGDSVICVDCDEEPLLRDWWWSMDLYTQPAHKEQLFATLSGTIDKVRGHPARILRQQALEFVTGEPWRCIP